MKNVNLYDETIPNYKHFTICEHVPAKKSAEIVGRTVVFSDTPLNAIRLYRKHLKCLGVECASPIKKHKDTFSFDTYQSYYDISRNIPE